MVTKIDSAAMIQSLLMSPLPLCDKNWCACNAEKPTAKVYTLPLDFDPSMQGPALALANANDPHQAPRAAVIAAVGEEQLRVAARARSPRVDVAALQPGVAKLKEIRERQIQMQVRVLRRLVEGF